MTRLEELQRRRGLERRKLIRDCVQAFTDQRRAVRRKDDHQARLDNARIDHWMLRFNAARA